MATRDELYTALRNADKAGDAEGARKLATYIQALPADDAAPTVAAKPAVDEPGMLTTFAGHVAKGISNVALAGPTLLGKGLSALGDATSSAPSISNLVTGAKPTSALGRAGQWVQDAVGAGKARMNSDLAPYKAANPLTAAAGEVTGQVLATAPVGGVIGGVVRTVAPALAAGRAAPLLTAIESAGMRTGAPAAATLAGQATNFGVRAAGGAITGGASAAAIDAEHAGTGAIIGGAMPAVISSLGAGGKVASAAWRAMTEAGDIAGARGLVKALEAATPDAQRAIIAQLRAAPTLVDGASPTAAQALGTPEAGILNRVVYDSPGGGALRAKIAQQGVARVNALESVAGTDANGFASARADMGSAIASRVIPEENAISKLVSKKYGAVDPNGVEAINLPITQMQAAVDKYMGRGTFGNGNGAMTALATAKELAKPAEVAAAPQIVDASGNPLRAAAEAAPRPGTWDEVGNLRSSINQAMNKAKLEGDKQAVGALNAQKNALDNSINSDLSESARSEWLEANASHAAKMDRFHTGPQKAIFRTGSDGLPLVEGGEVAAKFWGKGAGAAENVASFRKLVDDNPSMLGQFKSMITTQGAGTADAAGNLTTKFSKWVDQSLPGLRGAFTPEEVTKLQNIAADIDRNAASVKAGTSLGGSNTYQNAANALDLGLLDSNALEKAATMAPGLKYVAGPVLAGVKGYARNAKAKQLAELLSDSGSAANAIERLVNAGAAPKEANQILQYLNQGASRSVPVAESQRRGRRTEMER